MKPETDVVIGNDVSAYTLNEWFSFQTKHFNELVFCFQILKTNLSNDFNIHFPYKRGDFNIHSEIGGSLTSVLADLETIWMSTLQMSFFIDKSQLRQYRAVLVIPDVYNRAHLRELTKLLLVKMGFSSCFLVQVALFQCFKLLYLCNYVIF